MKKKVISLVVLIVILTTVFVGCGAPAGDISGIWYEETGYAGTIEFKAGGNFTMDVMGMKLNGTYTFDAAKGTGTAEFEGEKTAFKLEDGKLNIEGAIYTREKVEQQNLENLLEGMGEALEGMGN